MNYVLSEDDHNQLHGLVCRIDLLTALLEKTGDVTLSTESLFGTLASLREPIKEVLRAVSMRDALTADANMQPHHWFVLAQMLSGRGLYRWRDIVEMDDRLSRVAQADPAMGPVYRAWIAAMTDDGAIEMATGGALLDCYAGLVRPLAIAKMEPIDAHDVARLYNVENPEEVAQAIANAANKNAVAPRKATRKRAKAPASHGQREKLVTA